MPSPITNPAASRGASRPQRGRSGCTNAVPHRLSLAYSLLMDESPERSLAPSRPVVKSVVLVIVILGGVCLALALLMLVVLWPAIHGLYDAFYG